MSPRHRSDELIGKTAALSTIIAFGDAVAAM